MFGEDKGKALKALIIYFFCRMIKTEVSSSIAQQIGKLMSRLESSNYKLLKSLVLPLHKLTLAEDYALDEIILTISQYI